MALGTSGISPSPSSLAFQFRTIIEESEMWDPLSGFHKAVFQEQFIAVISVFVF